MPSSMPLAADVFPPASAFGLSGGIGTKSQWAGAIGDALEVTEALVLEERASRFPLQQINVQDYNVFPSGHAEFVSAAANTFNFNSIAGATTSPCDFIFPPGTYPTAGFQITHQYQRIIGSGGWYGGVVFDNQHATASTVTFQTIPRVTNQPARLRGCGMVNIKLTNSGNTSGAAIFIRDMTHARFDRVWTTDYRGRNGCGIDASNFADSIFLGCDWEWCSSTGLQNYAVLYFHNNNDNPLWAVDQIKFIGCRWEPCSERIADFQLGSGIGAGTQVNKVQFIACKWENSSTGGDGTSGSNDANQSQFLFNNCSWITFVCCEWTIQNKQVAHTLQTIFRLINSTSVSLTNAQFNFGSGAAPKVFTNFFILNGSAQLLSLSNVWVNSGNSTAFPTQVISCTNSPRVSYHNVGFTPTQGGAKTAADWITGAVANVGGGAGAGVIA